MATKFQLSKYIQADKILTASRALDIAYDKLKSYGWGYVAQAASDEILVNDDTKIRAIINDVGTTAGNEAINNLTHQPIYKLFWVSFACSIGAAFYTGWELSKKHKKGRKK